MKKDKNSKISKESHSMTVKIPKDLDIEFSCICKRNEVKKGAMIIDLIEDFVDLENDQ